MKPAKQQIEKACEIVAPWVHKTPVLTSETLNKLSDAELFFKCENFQKMGAFKMRGAVHAILQLSEAQKRKGVVTHSSGNFGQAVALAAKQLRVKAYIVMPNNAPLVKREAVKGYEAKVIICEATLAAREAMANQVVKETGATFLHPSNQIEVILGNATATVELLQEVSNLNQIITPVGGGGLLAGTALAAYFFGNDCKVLGAEPLAVDDAFRSLQLGQIQNNDGGDTIADGLKTQLGDVNFPIIKEHVSQIIRVTETEIIAAMKLVWERMKIVVEPSSAVALAAVLKEPKIFSGKKVGIILSGGNVDLTKLPFNDA